MLNARAVPATVSLANVRPAQATVAIREGGPTGDKPGDLPHLVLISAPGQERISGMVAAYALHLLGHRPAMQLPNLHSMIKLFTLLVLAFAAIPSFAQIFLPAPYVLVVNGGRFEFSAPYLDFVSVGIYNVQTNRYTLHDTIAGQSVTDGLIVGDTFYVATDVGLTAYQLPSLARIAQSAIYPGIRKLAAAGGKIWASRGFGTPQGQSYLIGFDRQTLTRTDTVAGLPGECEHLAVLNGLLYVGITYSFLSDSGSIVEISPGSATITRQYHLGRAGNGLGKIVSLVNKLIAYAQNGFGTDPSKQITIQPGMQGLNFETLALPYHGGYNVFGHASELFGQLGSGMFGVATPGDLSQVFRYPNLSQEIAGADFETGNEKIYTTSPTFNTTGYLRIYDVITSLTDSVQVGISPEVVRIYRPVLTAQAHGVGTSILVYPNPASTSVRIIKNGQKWIGILTAFATDGKTIELTSIDGQINISTLQAGLYTLRLDGTSSSTRIIKQ